MGALFKTSWGDLNQKHGYEGLNMTKYKKRNCGGWVNTCFTTKFLASVVLKNCPASESLEILVKKKKKKKKKKNKKKTQKTQTKRPRT